MPGAAARVDCDGKRRRGTVAGQIASHQFKAAISERGSGRPPTVCQVRRAIAAVRIPRIEPGPSQNASAPSPPKPIRASVSTASAHSKMATPASRSDCRQTAAEPSRHKPTWTHADAESDQQHGAVRGNERFQAGHEGEHAPRRFAGKTLAKRSRVAARGAVPANPALTGGAPVRYRDQLR